MSLLRPAWLLSCCCLSIAPLIELLPLPFCPGGILKLVASTLAGPLFAVHVSALIAYAVAYATNVSSKQTLKLPAAISAAAATALLLPLLAASRAIVALPKALTAAFGPVPPELLPPLFSLRRWVSPPPRCAHELSWPNAQNISRVFRRYRPTSALAPKLSPAYPLTQALWEGAFLNQRAATRRPGKLELLIFPPPPHLGETCGGGGSCGGCGGGGGAGGSTGLVVFIHCGGFWVGLRESCAFGCYLRQAHAHGWAAATVDYRLAADGWELSHMLSDVIAAVEEARWRCRSRLGRDPSRLVLIGSSAGAYLALQAGYIINKRARGRRVAAVVSLSGATDFGISRRRPVRLGAWDEAYMASTLCAGASRGDARTGCEPVSSLVSAHSPPTLLLHSRHDEYFSIEHAHSLVTALAAAAVPHVLLELPASAHSSEVGGAVWQLVGYAISHVLLALGSETDDRHRSCGR